MRENRINGKTRKQAWRHFYKTAVWLALLLFLYTIGISFPVEAEGRMARGWIQGETQAVSLTEEQSETEEEALEAAALSARDLYAKAAVLMDAKTGRILYEKNGSEELANASTTKILTCILILEQCDLEAVAEASGKAASQPKVRLGMRTGQKFYVKDMLYALMLESFNDCAVVLAEYAAGSVEEFAKQMNQKAEELGCHSSHFVTPNGLDGTDEGGSHHTTARDLAAIMRYCITESPKKEEFLEITRTASYSFVDAEGKHSYSCNNHNALLTMLEGALSGKTGFTNQAGYCYIGAARRDEKTLIAAVLACGWPPSKNYKWVDTTKLMQYGFEHFRLIEPSRQLTGLPDCRLKRCQTDQLSISQKGEFSVMADPEERLFALWRLPETLTGEQTSGSEIGCIEYYAGGEYLGSLSVESEENAVSLGYLDYLNVLWRRLLGK